MNHHILENRTFWDAMASDWVSAGERSWAQQDPRWGIWALPERDLSLLPANMEAMDAIELGCGTGYVSGWMARRGATVVAIDNSLEQLKTASRLARKHGVELALIHGNAERVPCPDARFDFAISEYGAAIWCDPEIWIAEAWRLLKPEGLLTFLGNHPLAMIATPVSGASCEAELHRPYFGMHEFDWRGAEVDPGGIEFNLTVSAWFDLFRRTGFEVLNYQELQAPAEATEDKFHIPIDWARQWPSEQIWQLRKF